MIDQGRSQTSLGEARRHMHRAATMLASVSLTLLAGAQPAFAVPASALRPLAVGADASVLAAAPTPRTAPHASAANSNGTTGGNGNSAGNPTPGSPYSNQTLRPRFYVPHGQVHKPHTSAADFANVPFLNTPANLLPPATPSKMLAKGVNTPAAPTLPVLPPPTSDDLAQTGDVVFTPAIQNLAAALDRNPVAIYNWVRDHVVYAPTYGAMQGADATLATLRGNDSDTASLLIALLRAANIPARYAYGTIQVPAAAAQNWVGGVNVPEAALGLFQQGGIPVQTAGSGGAIGALQIEHVWVEAYVDFNPSRGVVDRSHSTWVPLDGSYKQYRYTADLGVRAGVPLDTSTLASQLSSGATFANGGVTGLNTASLPAAFSAFSTQAQSYIAAHKPNATVSDVLGARSTIPEDLPQLAGSLPYATIALGGVFSDLPDALRWQVSYGIYASDFARTQGNALVSVATTLPKLVGKRLTLSFAGATAGDQSALATRLNANPLPSAVAATNIALRAQLTLDGNVLASGGSVPFGQALVGGLGIYDPQIGDWTYTADATVFAGETESLSAVGAGVSAAVLGASRDRLNAFGTQLAGHQYASLTQDAFVGEVLNYAGLAYATTVAGNADLMCRACGIVGYALPTITRVKTEAAVIASNGVPTSVSFPGVALSVESIGRTAVASDNNTAHALAFQRTFGEHASVYTQLLLDALFTDSAHDGRTATTVRALQTAGAAHQTIYQLTAANLAATMPHLTLDQGTLTTLQDAVGAGRSATVSQGNVTIGNWNGVGYLLEDPNSGSGDYEITGRDEANLRVTAGWLPLALAGTAVTVQGDATAAAVQGVANTEAGYTAGAVALLADYGSVPWSTFVGAHVVVSQWFLCGLWDGLPGTLADPGTTLTSTSGVDQFTTLPGAPSTNTAPYFSSNAVAVGAAGQSYQYFAEAVDPDGDAIAFHLASGPSGMTMSATGLVTWANPIVGAYPITLAVTDGKATTNQTYTLTIGQVMPLDMSLSIAPQFVNTGDTVTITVATTGGSGAITKALTVDGAPVALNAQSQAAITGAAPGAHAVVAKATDTKGTLTRNGAFGVAVGGDSSAPIVAITAPADGDVLTAPTPVTGSVSDANLVLWQLLVSPTGLGQWREIARGSQAVSNGALGTLDPTQLTNGQYDLLLSALDANGENSNVVEHVVVQGGLKVGLFSVTFTDLSLGVSGIPVSVTRTYDSRTKDQVGDFGYGWTLGYQNVNLQRNRPLGEDWELYQPGFLTFCIRPIGKRVVSIALADGKVHQFDVAASPDCDTAQTPVSFTMAFNPRSGTTSTLVALDAADLLYQGGTVFDPDTAAAFDSVQYQLTTIDNYKYLLQSGDGAHTFKVVQIVDPNGETITLSPQGIVSSNGAALQFKRDASNRITQVTDPAGRTVSYSYTAQGDLDSITNPLGQVARNQYATVPAALAHLMTSYTDPSGAQQLRNEYDASGKLIAQYDALGNKVDLSQRDLASNTQKVTDRNGNTTTYTFDDAGNITQVVDALGGVTKSTFDTYGNQLTVTDPLGRKSTTTYDAPSGTVLGSSDALGHGTQARWNFYTMMGNHSPQNMQSTTDELGHVTNYGYTDPGMMRSISDPLGHGFGFGWGGGNFDQLAQMSDATGNVTHYVNDAQGRKTQEADPIGNTTGYAYDTTGNLLSTTQTRAVTGQTQSLTTSNTYDSTGNLLSSTDALGHTTVNTWNAQNQLATETDVLGRVTAYSYDASGRAIKTVYPDNTSEATAYDANGNVVSETDRAGHKTVTTYDALDRPKAVTYADSNTRGTTYDAAGQITAATDELGRSTGYVYDAGGRKNSETDPLGNVTGFAYDDASKLTGITDALNHTTQFTFDAANRKTATSWPDGTADQYGYDNAGRKTSDTDAANRLTQYGYDADGRLNKVTDALNKSSSYGYDELGNRTTQTDALGHITQWAYDALGHATSHTLADNRFETLAYDAGGRVTNRTDYAGNAMGFTYDASDRVIEQRFVDSSKIATTYTPNGQVATRALMQGGGTQLTQYGYDLRDRLTDVQNADGSKLHYVYDAAGEKTSLTLTAPDGQSQTVAYTYDADGNLKTVSAAGKTFTYVYDAANRKIERDDPNGIVTKYNYDANGRLLSWTATKTGSALTLEQGTYTLNAAGQRTALVYVAPDSQTRNLGYGYDGAGKLISETRSLPAHNANWTLDAFGNRTQQVLDGQTSNYGYDATDRLGAITGASAATYAWDSNGQLQSRTQSGQTTAFAFNARHLLSGVTLPDGSKVVYGYAADGYIASRAKTVGTTTTVVNYLTDPNLLFAQVVAEYDASGHATAIYVYGDELLMRIRTPGNTYYHHDGHGSIVALSDDSGNAVQSYGYDAWGSMVESSGSDDNPYGYAAERSDADTALVYLRARWYEPRTGRFVSADPTDGVDTLPISHNKYLYASGDPLTGRDPSGYEDLISLSAAMDIASDLAISAVKNFAFDAIGNALTNGLLGHIGSSIKVPTLGNPGGAGIVMALATMCRAGKNRCLLRGVPTMVSGLQIEFTTAHIVFAETGNGTTSDEMPKALPFILVRGTAGRRPPIRGKPGCRGAGVGLVCDEYPYNSTLQGGKVNYRLGNVSLQWTPAYEGPLQGNYLSRFYGGAGVTANSPKGIFLNVGVPWLPSGYIDRLGNWHNL